MAGVADWLPRYDVRERHQCVIPLQPERALANALDTPVCPDRLVRLLFRLRSFGSPTESIGEYFAHHGFVVLQETPTVFVFGMALGPRGQPRRAADVASWRAWGPAGVQIAADFEAMPEADGHSRLSTETRVLALDGKSRLAFRIYWLVIGPFSALIRRRWLRAVAAGSIAAREGGD
jgi:hypothetical protein